MLLDRVLDAVARPWECEWRFPDGRKDVVLVRARHWWLEDAADVPDPLPDRLAARLWPASRPGREDLAALAALREPQVRKLIESGRCPAAAGLLELAMHDGSGALAALRFWARLPAGQRAQALEAGGLRLGDADPRLVRELLGPTLASPVGALDPAARAELRLRFEEVAPLPDALPAGAWRLSLRHPDPFRSRWDWTLGPNFAGRRLPELR